MDHLPCVEIEPGGPARASVIWLHGLGADGHDFEPIVPYLGLDPSLGVRFIFPHAPRIPVSINMGMVMPAWYDIRDLELGSRHDEEGIHRSTAQVRALLEREQERGVPAGRIVMAGFSQGGAIALHLGLRYEKRLAGLLALSTYLVRGETLETERSEANRGLTIFQGHGLLDPMVAHERGSEARDRLAALGYPVQWHEYPIQHAVSPEEIQDVGVWLGEVLGSDGPGVGAKEDVAPSPDEGNPKG